MALLLVAAALAACGGSDDDATPATATGPGGPDLTDADQRVVSVLLGFVRFAGEQDDQLAACADDACRDRVVAAVAEAGDEVDAALDEAGETSQCFSEVADALRSAADAARDSGDALAQVRGELSQASAAAAEC